MNTTSKSGTHHQCHLQRSLQEPDDLEVLLQNSSGEQEIQQEDNDIETYGSVYQTVIYHHHKKSVIDVGQLTPLKLGSSLFTDPESNSRGSRHSFDFGHMSPVFQANDNPSEPKIESDCFEFMETLSSIGTISTKNDKIPQKLKNHRLVTLIQFMKRKIRIGPCE